MAALAHVHYLVVGRLKALQPLDCCQQGCASGGLQHRVRTMMTVLTATALHWKSQDAGSHDAVAAADVVAAAAEGLMNAMGKTAVVGARLSLGELRMTRLLHWQAAAEVASVVVARMHLQQIEVAAAVLLAWVPQSGAMPAVGSAVAGAAGAEGQQGVQTVVESMHQIEAVHAAGGMAAAAVAQGLERVCVGKAAAEGHVVLMAGDGVP